MFTSMSWLVVSVALAANPPKVAPPTTLPLEGISKIGWNDSLGDLSVKLGGEVKCKSITFYGSSSDFAVDLAGLRGKKEFYDRLVEALKRLKTPPEQKRFEGIDMPILHLPSAWIHVVGYELAGVTFDFTLNFTQCPGLILEDKALGALTEGAEFYTPLLLRAVRFRLSDGGKGGGDERAKFLEEQGKNLVKNYRNLSAFWDANYSQPLKALKIMSGLTEAKGTRPPHYSVYHSAPAANGIEGVGVRLRISMRLLRTGELKATLGDFAVERSGLRAIQLDQHFKKNALERQSKRANKK